MKKKELEENLKDKNELLRKLSCELRQLSGFCLQLDQLILLDSLGDALHESVKK